MISRVKVTRRQEIETLMKISKKYLSETSHKLLMSQVRMGQINKFGRRWPPYVKNFSLSLYSKSSTYGHSTYELSEI
jgi:hypothetical protein